MKKNFVTLSLTLIISCAIHSATLIGTILDIKDQTPIEFANVVVTAPGNIIPVGGGITDNHGRFQIHSLKKGKYFIKAQFIGYIPAQQTLELSTDSLNIGTIQLLPNQKELAEVEVVAQASQMTIEPDKKVFKIDQNITTAGGAVTDALKNIPSVTVDNEGNVSLRKNGNVQILIDGRPSGLTADNQAQILQQIPAESVESVEIVTNPSAKYDAENSGGVINIVMKQNRKAGFNGNLTAGVSYPQGVPSSMKKNPGQNYGLNLNFNVGKIDGYATIGIREMDMYTHTLGIQNDTLYQVSNSKNYMQGLFMRAGINYHINKKHTVSLSGFGIKGNGNSTSIQDFSTKNNPEQHYNRYTNGNGQRPSINYNLDYKFDIDKNTVLTAGAAYSAHNFHMSNTFQNDSTNFKLLQNRKIDNTQGMDADISQWIYKADFSKKFNEKSKLEAGWQSNINSRLSTSSAFDNIKQVSLNSWFNSFDYDEQIHAGYATYSDQLGSFKYQVGLRGENFTRHFTNTLKDSLGHNSTTENRLSNFDYFPSAYLSYTLANKDELQLNYSRKINRPRGRQINPFFNISDPMNISHGNPNLNPEMSNGLEFNYIKIWADNTLNLTAFYRLIENQIQSLRSNGSSYSTYFNTQPLQKSGIEAISKNTIAKIINLTSSVSLYYGKQLGKGNTKDPIYINNYEFSSKDNEWWSLNASLLANLMLSKTLSGQIVTKYVGPDIQGQNTISEYVTMDIGLRQSFLHRMLILALTVNDVLNTQATITNSSYNAGKMYSKSVMNGRTIGAQVIINFGNMKPKKEEIKKRMEQMQDSNDQGGGMGD